MPGIDDGYGLSGLLNTDAAAGLLPLGVPGVDDTAPVPPPLPSGPSYDGMLRPLTAPPPGPPSVSGAPAVDATQTLRAGMLSALGVPAPPPGAPPAPPEAVTPGQAGFFGGLADLGRGAASALVGTPEFAREAARGVGRQVGLVAPSSPEEIAQRQAQAEAERQARPTWAKESRIGRNRTDPLSVRGQAFEAGESTVQSLGPMAAGAAIGAGIGAFTGPGALVGAGLGALIGTAAGILGFSGQQAESSYQAVKAATNDEEVARQAGLINGLIEGGGEALGDALFLRAGRLVPPGVRRAVGTRIAQAVGLRGAGEGGGDILQAIASNKGAVWRAAKDMALVTAPAELATELGQYAGEAEVEKAYGAGDGATLNDALRVVIPTLIMTGLGASGAHLIGGVKRAEINRQLVNPDDGSPAGMARRAQAAATVEQAVRQEDPELADLWRRYAVAAIGDGVPVTIDEDQFFRDLTEAGAAGRRLAGQDALPAADLPTDQRFAHMLAFIQARRAAQAVPPARESDPNAENVDGIPPTPRSAPTPVADGPARTGAPADASPPAPGSGTATVPAPGWNLTPTREEPVQGRHGTGLRQWYDTPDGAWSIGLLRDPEGRPVGATVAPRADGAAPRDPLTEAGVLDGFHRALGDEARGLFARAPQSPAAHDLQLVLGVVASAREALRQRAPKQAITSPEVEAIASADAERHWAAVQQVQAGQAVQRRALRRLDAQVWPALAARAADLESVEDVRRAMAEIRQAQSQAPSPPRATLGTLGLPAADAGLGTVSPPNTEPLGLKEPTRAPSPSQTDRAAPQGGAPAPAASPGPATAGTVVSPGIGSVAPAVGEPVAPTPATGGSHPASAPDQGGALGHAAVGGKPEVTHASTLPENPVQAAPPAPGGAAEVTPAAAGPLPETGVTSPETNHGQGQKRRRRQKGLLNPGAAGETAAPVATNKDSSSVGDETTESTDTAQPLSVGDRYEQGDLQHEIVSISNGSRHAMVTTRKVARKDDSGQWIPLKRERKPQARSLSRFKLDTQRDVALPDGVHEKGRLGLRSEVPPTAPATPEVIGAKPPATPIAETAEIPVAPTGTLRKIRNTRAETDLHQTVTLQLFLYGKEDGSSFSAIIDEISRGSVYGRYVDGGRNFRFNRDDVRVVETPTPPTQDETAPAPEPKPRTPKTTNNVVFTDDMAEQARAVLRRKLGQLNSGIDPEILQAGIVLAGWHIEQGARTFAAFTRSMLDDMGETVKPYLKQWYMAAKMDPRATDAMKQDMDALGEVEAADVDAILNAETPSAAAGTTEDQAETPASPRARWEGYRVIPGPDTREGELQVVEDRAGQNSYEILATFHVGPRGNAIRVRYMHTHRGFADQVDMAIARYLKETPPAPSPTLETRPTPTEEPTNARGATEPAPDSRDQAGVSAPGGRVADGRADRGPDDRTLAPTATEDGGAAGAGGHPGGVRAPDRVPTGRGDGELLQGGDGVAGQPGGGQSGLAAGRPGSGRRADAQPGRPAPTGRPGARADTGTADRGDTAAPGTGEPTGAGNTEAVTTEPTQAETLEARAENFHVDDPARIYGGTPKQRFAKNRAAIELYRDLTDSGRAPTPDEREVLAGYTGWGSFGQEVFQGTWDRAIYKDGWRDENDWLRGYLGEQEWKSAADSILNAHYTDPPTVQAMWSMVEKLGFRGGRVLEPSMGIGNFFGLMPKGMQDASELTGIELDSLTAGMAKLLYPRANVQQKGYQESQTPDGFYDLVIGNWPFASQGPADRRYNTLSPSLHDYFFLKALDQTRPGGLVVGITSRYSMDAKGRGVRMELARKGDLVAAFRLPSGAFEEYAGTKVVTDIIILKRRETDNTNPGDELWVNTDELDLGDNATAAINRYYLANRDHILGTLGWGSGTTYGRQGVIVERPDDLRERLSAAADGLADGTYTPRAAGKAVRYLTNNTQERTRAVTLGPDGGLYQVQGERLANLNDVRKWQTKDTKQTAEREAQLKALVGLRRDYGRLIDAERDGAENVEDLRRTLREHYQAFRDAHGPVRDSFGLWYLAKVDDPFFPSLAALESVRDGTHVPAPILERAITRRTPKFAQPTVTQAYVMARNQGMTLDMAAIAAAAQVPEDQAARELLEAGAVFAHPAGGYEPADIYLGGNVRRKLREARAAAEQGRDMARNIAALEQVIPKDIPYFNIEARLGANWVAPQHYQAFVAEEFLGLPDETEEVAVEWRINRWVVKPPEGAAANATQARWLEVTEFTPQEHTVTLPNGTTRTEPVLDEEGNPVMNRGQRWTLKPRQLLQAAFNNLTLKIRDKDENGNWYTLEGVTRAANERVRELREAFESWAWRAPERKVALERDYNEVMNAIAPPKFDGSFLTFDGMALQRGENEFDLRQHQVNAIWRGLVQGSGLYAHEVGTGKTMSAAGIAVESRRFGLAQKPMILAHNANSAAVATEIQEMYPGARVLYINNLKPAEIKATLAQIRNDDWDAVVLPHSLIDRLTLSQATLERMAAADIAALEQAFWEEMDEDQSGSDRQISLDDEEAIKKLRNPTAKELAKARLTIKAKIAKAAQRASREDAIPFEDLGVDMLLVDEAHLFKKPPMATRMSLRGLNKGTSDRSLSLKFLTDYIKEQRGGRGVHLFTGTPITNTLAEIFHMQRYVMSGDMKRDGIDEWDSWFNTFASAVSDVEYTAAGDYEPVNRLASFINVAELRKMMSPYMDVVFADDMPEFKPRETASGKTLASPDLTEAEREDLLHGRTEHPIGRPYRKVIMDVAEMSPEQGAILGHLQQLAAQWRAADGRTRVDWMKSGDEHSPILIEGAAARTGMDGRMEDLSLPDYPNSKVNRCVRTVLKHYHSEPQASQVIFMDKGYSDTRTVKKQEVPGLNLAKELRAKLIDGGIPEHQIAIVAGGVTPEKKKEIADAVNAGRIRVVIGQTETLGTGVNMQRQLRAMHHIDAPWTPGELEQRNGRGWRQGNTWNTVLEYRYITERIDGRRWSVLAVKDRFIKAFMKADESTRVIEGDAASDEEGGLAETLSEAVGDPRVLQRQKLRQDVQRLQLRERVHAQGVVEARETIAKFEREIPRDLENATALDADADRYEAAVAAAGERQKQTYRADLAGYVANLPGLTLTHAELMSVRDHGWGPNQKDRELAKRVQAAVKTAEAAGNQRPKEPTSLPFEARLLRDTFTTRAEFDEAMKTVAQRMPQDGGEHEIGAIFGFPIMAQRDRYNQGGLKLQIRYQAREGGAKVWGNTAREFVDTLKSFRAWAADNRRGSERKQADIDKLDQVASEPFPRAKDLARKKTRLDEIERDMSLNPVPPPAWLRHGAPFESLVYWGGNPVAVDGHQWSDDGWFVLVQDQAGETHRVPYLEVRNADGERVFEERPFVKPGGQAAPVAVVDEQAVVAPGDQPSVSDAVQVDTDPLRDPVFTSTSKLSNNDRPPGLAVAEVQHVVTDFGRRLFGATAPRVQIQVFATQDDAFGPGSIGRVGRVKGAYYPVSGKIVLVAAHLRDLRDARDTLRHEVVGHLGLNLLAPDDKRAFLEQVLQAAESSRYLRRLKAEETKNNPSDPLKVAEEIFARVAESGRSDIGLAWDRLLVWLRERLSALGLIEGRMSLPQMRLIAADLARGVRAGQAQQTFPASDQAQFGRAETEDVRFALAPPADQGGSPLGGGRHLLDSLKDALNGAGAWAGDRWRQALPVTLGSVTLRQLADLGASHIPGIQGYLAAQQRMDTRRNAMVEESGVFATEEWAAWARRPEHRAEAEALATLMHDATRLQTDPADYRPLTVALQLGPSELFWRNREATEANVRELVRQARQMARSKQREDRGMGGYYLAAAKKLKAAVAAQQAREQALPDLQRRWNALSPHAQGLYRQARDLFEKRSRDMLAALEARIMGLEGVDEARKQALAAKIRAEFESPFDEKGNPRIGPYFPLQRFGRFYLFARRYPTGAQRTFRQQNGTPFTSAESARGALKRRDLKGIEAQPVQVEGGWELQEVGEPGFWMFESIPERRAAAAELRASGWRVQRQGLTKEARRDLDGVSEGFIAEAVELLQAKGATQEADDLYQLYLSTLQQMSIRKHFLHRKGTTGYSNDALRAFAWNMMRLANQVAKLEHLPTLERLLREVEDQKKELQKSLAAEGGDVTVPDAYYQELLKRHQWIAAPDNAAWTNFTSALGFFWYLGASPAAALVNLTQTPILALPVLASRHGWRGASATLGRAFLDVAKGFNPQVVKGFLTGQPHPGEAANLTEEERRAFAAWDLSGVRDRTQAHNLAGIGDTDAFWNGPTFNRAMAVVSSGFHAAEIVNRDTTLLAAYRLARAAGQSHAQAVQAAEEATWSAHFDYGNSNRARWMQSNAAKALLMFRSYSQHMTYFLWRNLYQWTRGESPEVRREARTQLLGSLGMTALFGGVLGLPLGTVFLIANLAAAAFGDDDDPWDAEIEFRNWLASIFPRDVADIIDRGAITKLTGLDWASRVGLRSLWWRDPDRDLDGAGTYQYIVEQLMGPLGGIAAGPFTAADLIGEGQWARAAEAVTPKMVKDVLKAGRFATEGVVSKKGAPIVERDDLNGYQVVWKLLGMNPDEIAVRQDANAAVKLYEERILNRRSRLMTGYAMALIHQDPEAQTTLLAQIRAFNEAQPALPITARAIRTSVRNRERSTAQAEHGMVINQRLRGQLEAVGAFGE